MYTHRLFLIFFFVRSFHDLFRMIKKFWIVGGLIDLAERIMREVRNGISEQCRGNSTKEGTNKYKGDRRICTNNRHVLQ